MCLLFIYFDGNRLQKYAILASSSISVVCFSYQEDCPVGSYDREWSSFVAAAIYLLAAVRGVLSTTPRV